MEQHLGPHLVVPPIARADTIELIIAPASVPSVMRTLRDEPELRYEILADLSGVDTGRTMQVVYHFWSALSSDWLRVIADGLSRDDPRVPSITFLWNGAEWAEREAYDMFGIVFEGNRDLRRVYMPPDYVGFPLRKDFALPDDAARSPGEGIRAVETPFLPAESRGRMPMRLAAGTGATIGPDGRLLALTAGSDAIDARPGAIGAGSGEDGGRPA